MTESVVWVQSFIANYSAWKYVIIFLGAAFGGEPAVLVLSFLAAQGIFPLAPYIAVSFLGVFSSDCLYFFLGRTAIAKKAIEHRYATKTISVIIEVINRLSRGRHTIAFIMAKFVIGTRAVLIMYVSKTGLSLGKFMRHNLPAIVIWLVIVSATGYLSGLGFAHISKTIENVYAGIGFVLLILIILMAIQRWFNKTIEKEEEKVLEEENMI
ncbi:MAG: hypothetical protein WCT29_00305 [Candidatus Paceibacterota bacterium]|jgi:membrane protein DedA with SNARE-associated domain